MATTADYLNKLVDQKNILADNLVTKGVEATHDETLETLVPKVLEISGGGGEGIYPIGEDGKFYGEVTVPNHVKTLYRYLFSGTNVTNVVLQDGLTDIEQYAFSDCTALLSVTLPKTLQTIGTYAFGKNVPKLTTMTIPNDMTNFSINSQAFYSTKLSNDCINQLTSKAFYIGDSAFRGAANATELTINTIDGSYCFQDCENLAKVNILHGDKYNTIPQYAFYNCPKLKLIGLPDEIQIINAYSFASTGIQEINLSPNICELKNNVFSDCKDLEIINISENTTIVLGSSVFSKCVSLKNDVANNILNHTTRMGTSIFNGCTFLTNITTKFSVNSMFQECTNLQCCEITDSVIKMAGRMFYKCTSLETVILPSTITSADSNSLTTTTSDYAFYNCTALKDVQLGQDWNMSLRLNVSNNLTHDSMVAMFNSLKDLTGDTAKTLTLGSTNLAKLTDEEKAIATNKNWTLA